VVRLGIIGCGFVTVDRHLPALRHVSEIEIAGVADRHASIASDVARQFDCGPVVGVDELLSDAGVDAIAICTPPETHAELALAALAAGKHVFVEKPLAPTVADADRLLDGAAGSARTIMVGFNLRRHRFVQGVRDVVESGRLGDVQAVRTAYTSPILDGKISWHARRAQGGGGLYDRAIHHFDLWRFLLGTEIADVFAVTRGGRGDDQAAVITGRTADGVAITTLALDDSVVTNDVAVYGTDGAVFADCCRVDGFHLAPRSEPPGSPRSRLRRAREALATPRETVRAVRRGGDFRVAYEEQWRDFADAIHRNVSQSPSLAEGRAALAIAEAAAESADTGVPVRVAPAR
jgi:predicted dehydrogenase